jgi:hypothetical protein
MNAYEPIFKEIATGLLETIDKKPNFSNDCFIDIVLIFQTALFDKIYNLQQKENMEFGTSIDMAENCGKELRKFIKTFSDLDTFDLVKDYSK